MSPAPNREDCYTYHHTHKMLRLMVSAPSPRNKQRTIVMHLRGYRSQLEEKQTQDPEMIVQSKIELLEGKEDN